MVEQRHEEAQRDDNQYRPRVAAQLSHALTLASASDNLKRDQSAERVGRP
jgi:hypothetical protein